MLKIIGTMLFALALALLAGCGDDDERAADLDSFCIEFQRSPQLTTGFTAADGAVTDALVFFQQLERTAPEEIEAQVSTVVDGLESLAGALDDVEGGEGQEITDAVQQAADVDLDELGTAAAEVEQYAIANCEDVEPAE